MPLSEADTRAKLIDPALHQRGWTEDLIKREETAGSIVRRRRDLRRQAPGWYRYFWKPAKMYPISSGLPRSATASAMALWYFSFSKGDSFARSNSSTPTLTYWASTNPRNTCCFALKWALTATLARVALSSRVSVGRA